MSRITFSALALVLLALGFVPGTLAAPGPKTARPVQDEIEARLKKLEERVDKLESEKAALELKLEAHQKLLKSAYDWMASLPDAAESLSASMDRSRELGFESAGWNPKARTEILDSLKGFARALNAGNPAGPKKAEK